MNQKKEKSRVLAIPIDQGFEERINRDMDNWGFRNTTEYIRFAVTCFIKREIPQPMTDVANPQPSER